MEVPSIIYFCAFVNYQLLRVASIKRGLAVDLMISRLYNYWRSRPSKKTLSEKSYIVEAELGL